MIGAAVAAVVFVVIQLHLVVIPVAIALLLAALLAPLVSAAMSQPRLPRGLATGIVLVGGLTLLSAVLSFVVNALLAGLPDLQGRLSQSYQLSIKPLLAGPPLRIPLDRLNDLPDAVRRSLVGNSETIANGALSTAATLSQVAAAILLGLFVLVFFLYDGARIWAFLLRGAPHQHRARVDIAGRRAFAALIGYARATVLVAVADALGIGLGLWLLRVPLVVPLAALVFLGAFVPVVGAVLSGSVAVLIALVANGPVTAAIALGVVIAVMQLEGNVLQPLLLGRAVRLHPLVVVLAVAGGVVVAGLSGALLAVPLVAVLTTGVRALTEPAEPSVPGVVRDTAAPGAD
jgi:putative heme transporter